MGYKVIFSAQSNQDLGEVVCFLAQKNPAAAERLGHTIVNHGLDLSTMPHVGAPVKNRPGVRRIFHRPCFLIFYRVNDAARSIEIVRIWDVRKNPAGFRF